MGPMTVNYRGWAYTLNNALIGRAHGIPSKENLSEQTKTRALANWFTEIVPEGRVSSREVLLRTMKKNQLHIQAWLQII